MANQTAEKAEKFERLATKRTEDILKKVRLLSNLSNKNNYSYSEHQIREMFGAIEREIKVARERFGAQPGKCESGFRFSK